MTLNELRYIVALSRERHFGRAAAACFISQPSLSIAVKKLEEELGVALFERRGNDIILTDLGQLVVVEAEAIFKRVVSIKHLAQSAQNPLAGNLRLGIIYTIAPFLLPPLVREIMTLAPETRLMLQENFTHRLLELVREGELDAAIVATPVTSQFSVINLYDEPFFVVVPEKHDWAERKSISSSELSDQTLLLLGQGHCFRDHVLQTCPGVMGGISGIENTNLEGVTIDTIRHTVSSGYGISVLPATSKLAPESRLRYVSFDTPAPTRRVSLISRKAYLRPEAIDMLNRAVRQCNLPEVRYL